MGLVYVIAALAVALPAVLVPLLAGRVASALARGRVADRARLAVDGLVAALGRIPAAIAVLLAAMAAAIVVFWPFGKAISRLQDAVDWPVWRWFHGADRRDATWERVNSWVTLIGERPQLKIVSIAAAVVLAVLWRRRFWIPLVAMLGQFVVEQYLQQILKLVVDRGHPPTDLGTYPSGGVARVVMTFGTIGLLLALTFRLRTRGRVTVATVVAVLMFVEAYTRIYVQKHWLTDVLSALLFGPVLFFGFASAVGILAGRRPDPPGGALPESLIPRQRRPVESIR